jgi:gluconolactonase
MRAIERSAILLLTATLGCAADAYELGALGDETGTDSDGAMSSSGSDGVDTAAAGVDPLEGASSLKVWQDQGLTAAAGGIWDPDAGWLLVADTATDTVVRVDLAGVTPYLSPANGPRGLGLDADGTPLVAQGDVPRVVRAPLNEAVTIVAEGPPMLSPQSIVASTTGNRYVTDAGAGAVLRIAADGTVEVAVADLLDPRGIALSPGDETLYVAERAAARILAYRVEADGSLATPDDLTTASAPINGLCIDDAANVYAATDAGLEVFDPAGARWGLVATTQPLTDCTFGHSGGSPLLLLTSATTVYAMDLRGGGPP